MASKDGHQCLLALVNVPFDIRLRQLEEKKPVKFGQHSLADFENSCYKPQVRGYKCVLGHPTFMCIVNLNSSPYECVISALPTKPSPQISPYYIFS